MKKKILSFLTMICMTVALLSSNIAVFAETSGACGNNLTWELDSSGTLTVSGTGAMTDYDDYSSTPPWHSSDYSIYSVIIEDGVTSIGDSAFSSCYSLTSVTIPDSVTSIGRFAFSDCSNLKNVYITDLTAWCNIEFDYSSNPLNNGANLYINGSLATDITIPDSVTSIGSYAFDGCTSLTSITIPDSVTSIGKWAFYNCSSLTKVYWNAKNVEDFSYYDRIFSDSGVKEVIFGDSVEKIPSYAFYYCRSLTSVTIPDSVTSIGQYAFSGCYSLAKVNISDIDAWCDIEFADYSSNPLYYAKKLYIDNKVVTKAELSDKVTRLNDYAFYYCSSLTSVTIPDSVTTIDYSAFSDCNNLTNVYITDLTAWCNIEFDNYSSNPLSNEANLYINGSLATDITIPDTVTSIGKYAFFYYSGLTSITFPEGVTSIGEWAFCGCNNLTSITIPNSVTSIGISAFVNTGYYNNVSNWENDVLYVGNYLVQAKSTVVSCKIKSGTKCIANSAFSGCSSLTSVTIPNSVTSIGDSAFRNCSSLTNITIPDSVTSIGYFAFSGCESLTNITVSEDNTKYSLDSFGVLYNKDKTELIQYPCGNTQTEFSIPNSVTSLCDSAFSCCSSLTSVTIPNSVTSIGDYAFEYCDSLTSVTIGNSVTSIGCFAFEHCDSLTNITIGNGVTSIDERAFYDTGYYNNESNWENDVLYIGNYLIEAKNTVTSCKIKSGTKCIANSALYYCESLTSITIPDSVKSINSYAFCGCNSLTSVIIGNGVKNIGDNAFECCWSLGNVTIGNEVTSIGDSAFASCSLLADVYYSGSKTDWNNIDIGSGNDYLKNATITYLSNTKTTVSDDGKTFTVKPINIANGNTVILALYNGDSFVGMEEPQIYNGEDLTFETNKAYTNAKIMVWNSLDGMKPQCEAEEVE